METLKNYLDNMFAAFPKTPEILNLKSDLINGMEDKYNELKSSGKSENEAIAIAISEFGNIEELISELNISQHLEPVSYDKVITMQEAETILADKKKYGSQVAFGVWLCIIGAAIFLLLGGLISAKTTFLSGLGVFTYNEDFLYGLSFVPLFLLIAVAVGIFIYSGSKLEKYENLLKSRFVLDYGAENYLQTSHEKFAPKNTLNILIAVFLCIFAVLIFLLFGTFASNTVYEDLLSAIGLFLLLLIISFAVVLFIKTGTISETYSALLHVGEFSEKDKKDNKIVSVVSAIVWPLATAVYLLWSFLSGDWHITWLVWPVTGILFGAFAAVCNILIEKN